MKDPRDQSREMTPAECACLDQAHAESVSDLDRLLEWARSRTGSEVEVSASITATLLGAGDWGTLELATVLGVAIARLAEHEAVIR